MLTKLVATAALVAAFLVAPATGAGAADPYSPPLPTETRIDIVVKGPGKPIRVKVSASANHTVPPEGRIDIKISKGSAGPRGARVLAAAPVWQTSVRFEGQPVTVEGPALARGSYVAQARFTPDDTDFFRPSENVTRFRVSGGSVGGETDGSPGGVDGSTGGLPSTGGPDLMWLLLGGGLLVAGAGSVAYSRRRELAFA